MEKIRIAIVEDHHLFREGIKLILNNAEEMMVVAEFNNGKEFTDQLEKIDSDVILMDIAMPEMDGIEATRIAIEKNPSLKVLVLSMFGDEDYYYQMINAGAKGFLLKDCKSHELIEAITWIASGENYFSQELLRKIVFKYGASGLGKAPEKSSRSEISKREYEILRLICQGFTNAEIAAQLFLSHRTVEGHRANLLKKTNTKNTVNLIMHALKEGLIKV
jgi:DNA-binding NarL/FixJ family response regulator